MVKMFISSYDDNVIFKLIHVFVTKYEKYFEKLKTEKVDKKLNF